MAVATFHRRESGYQGTTPLLRNHHSGFSVIAQLIYHNCKVKRFHRCYNKCNSLISGINSLASPFRRFWPWKNCSRPPGRDRLQSDRYKIGGSVWESNPPERLLTPHTGFEDQRAHQNSSTPMLCDCKPDFRLSQYFCLKTDGRAVFKKSHTSDWSCYDDIQHW